MEKPFDLEERTFLFAKECRIYIQKLPKTISNHCCPIKKEAKLMASKIIVI